MYNPIPKISVQNNSEKTDRIASFMTQVMSDFERLYILSGKPIRDINLIIDDIKNLSDEDKATFSKFVGHYSKLFEPRIFINMPFSTRDKFIFWQAQGFKDGYLLHSFIKNEIKKPEEKTTENILIFKQLIEKTKRHKNDRTFAFSEFYSSWINNETPTETDNKILFEIFHQIPTQPSVFFEELILQFTNNPEKKDLYLKKTKDILKENGSYQLDFKRAVDDYKAEHPTQTTGLNDFISAALTTKISSKNENPIKNFKIHCL